MKKAVIVLGLALIALSPALAQDECFPAPDGMVAWWPGDGNADDVQGNADGAFLGDANALVPGQVAESFEFDGVGDAVAFGDVLDEVFAGADRPFTIDFWTKLDIIPTGTAAFVSKVGDTVAGPANQREFSIVVRSDGSLDLITWFSLGTPINARIVRAGTTLQANVWYHITVAYDGSIDTGDGLDRVTIYLNGSPESTSLTFSGGPLGSIQNGAANLAIGAHVASNQNGGFFFPGFIDEVEIFDRILSPGEIYAIYAAGSAGKCKDEDGDGYRPPEDCDESDPTINPDALELPGNFVDENCDGSLGDCDPCFVWRNHGEYIRCTSQAVSVLVNGGYITEEEGDGLVSSAARSDIGKKGYVAPECQ